MASGDVRTGGVVRVDAAELAADSPCPSVRRKSCIVRMPLRMAEKVSLPSLEQLTAATLCIRIPSVASQFHGINLLASNPRHPSVLSQDKDHTPATIDRTLFLCCRATPCIVPPSLGSNYPTNHVHWNRPVCSHRSVCVVKHLSNGSYMCYSTTAAHKSTLLVQ
jgi:hypothetical protein